MEPLVDPFTGARLFNIASHNLFDAAVTTRNVEGGFDWFAKVQRAIYKSYAALASAVQQNIKDRYFSDQEGTGAQATEDSMFLALQEFFDPIYNKQQYSTQNRLSMLKKSGGHLPAHVARLEADTRKNGALFHQGITVVEQGSLIEVPRDLRGNTMHLWTVVRVLQHTAPAKTRA